MIVFKVRQCLFIGTLVTMIIIVDSCKKSINSKSALIEYVNEPKNGLKITQTIGKAEASVTYKPWQLVAINNQNIKNKSDTAALKSLRNKYFFVLSLSADHKELLRQIKFSDYSEMVQVLAFRMAEYISAVADNGKPIVPEECLFGQTYGMSSANQVLIAFDRSKFKNAKKIKIRIKEFGFNLGYLDYEFNLKDINELQDIIINN